MKTDVAESAQGDPIRLEGELTIYTAAESFGRLKDSMGQDPDCDLDLSDVTDIDSAGLQLLLWVEQTSKARGGRLRLVGVSEAVCDVMALLQLERRFGIESTRAEEGTS